MRIVFHTNCISPHRLPLAQALADAVGVDDYLYIYDEPLDDDRVNLGWKVEVRKWLRSFRNEPEALREKMLGAEAFCSSCRDLDIFEARAKVGLKSYYTSERWFKPLFGLPGWIRMLVPSYFKTARRMSKLLSEGHLLYLPAGVWAASDMLRIVEFFKGRFWRSLSCKIKFEGRPLGEIQYRGKPVEYMRMWGYCVAPSQRGPQHATANAHKPLRVLWVGRFLDLKHVDDILKAVCFCVNKVASSHSGLTLDLYGCGPAREKLLKMIASLNLSSFVKMHSAVPINEVRELMKSHDLYVFSSDAYEGWGAVVNEALEEGMLVLGTYEAGASATLLPESNLYHAGDWKQLAKLMSGCIDPVDVTAWRPCVAAGELIKLFGLNL